MIYIRSYFDVLYSNKFRCFIFDQIYIISSFPTLFSSRSFDQVWSTPRLASAIYVKDLFYGNVFWTERKKYRKKERKKDLFYGNVFWTNVLEMCKERKEQNKKKCKETECQEDRKTHRTKKMHRWVFWTNVLEMCKEGKEQNKKKCKETEYQEDRKTHRAKKMHSKVRNEGVTNKNIKWKRQTWRKNQIRWKDTFIIK